MLKGQCGWNWGGGRGLIASALPLVMTTQSLPWRGFLFPETFAYGGLPRMFEGIGWVLFGAG